MARLIITSTWSRSRLISSSSTSGLQQRMKAIGFLQSAASTTSTILPIPRKAQNPLTKFSYFHRPISLNHISNSTSPASLKPQTPLFLKPPAHSSTFSDLKTFANWAKTLASSVGSSFADSDNGPDSALLLRELRWFLEDSIEDPSIVPHLGTTQIDECHSPKDGVKIRASLEEMYRLWNQRVEQRRPFQYIVGCEHWRDLVLSVQEGVLIPRPETEKIVELVSDALTENEALRHGLWADLGTGSGALAIGIGRLLGGNGRLIAIDLSPTAVSVANFNVERYGLQETVEVRQGSWFDPIGDAQGELVGLVSNPPYIPSGRISGLQAEVAKHEPMLALDGGSHGMESLLHICERAVTMLKPGGFFAFETDGEEQSKALSHYMENECGSSFRDIKIVSDFVGIARFVAGFRA